MASRTCCVPHCTNSADWDLVSRTSKSDSQAFCDEHSGVPRPGTANGADPDGDCFDHDTERIVRANHELRGRLAEAVEYAREVQRESERLINVRSKMAA